MNQKNEIVIQGVNLSLALKEHYKIDYYQREYAWGKNETQELIDDLLIKFKEGYNESDSSEKALTYPQYFLGSFVVSAKSSGNYIIDGQQRLTTLSLLFLYLYHRSKHSKADTDDAKEYVFSRKVGKSNFNISVELRLPMMECILNEDFENADRSDKTNSRILDNYNTIKETLEFVDDNTLSMFYYWLCERVVMSKIVAHDDNEAYTIFESMNDRGKSLTNLDMLKGFLLSLIDNDVERAKAINIWKDLENSLGEKFDDFITDFLRSKWALSSATDSKKNPANNDWIKLKQHFHRWFKEHRETRIGLSTSNDVVEFFNYLEYYAKLYCKIKKYKETMTEGYEDLCYLHYQKVSHVETLILGLVDYKDKNEDLKIKIISKFLSIRIAHYAWTEFTHQDTNIADLIVKLFKNIRELPEHNEPSVLIWFFYSELQDKINNSWGLFNANEPPKFGGGKAKKRVFDLLSILTFYIDKQDNSNTSFEDIHKTHNIEHVLAANYLIHKDEFNSQEELDYVRDEIGGLGILEKTINSSLNDSPYSYKVSKYPHYNRLLGTLDSSFYSQSPNLLFQNHPGLNSFIDKHPQLKTLFKSYQSFNKTSIKERNLLYSEICKIIWNIEDLLEYSDLEVSSFAEIESYINQKFKPIDEPLNEEKELNKLVRKSSKNTVYVLKDSWGHEIKQSVVKKLYTQWVQKLALKTENKSKFYSEQLNSGRIFKDSNSVTSQGVNMCEYIDNNLYLLVNLSKNDAFERMKEIADLLNIEVKIDQLQKSE